LKLSYKRLLWWKDFQQLLIVKKMVEKHN
jgi:pantothenate synthetase